MYQLFDAACAGEAAAISPAPGPPCARSAQPWILATTIIASSMAFIDGTVVNVALPALAAIFGRHARERAVDHRGL